MSGPRIAIIGAGRAGSAIFHAWTESGGEPPFVWTRSATTAAAAQRDGTPAQTGHSLPSFAGYDLLLLAVSDASVGILARALERSALGPETVIAHLSGALDLSPLEPLKALGLQVGSLHPLVSIAHRRSSLRGAVAAVDASTPVVDALLTDVAERIGLRVIRPRGDRARYHAAAAVTGNFPQVLLEVGIRLLVETGLTRDEARAAVGPLMLGAAKNAVELGPTAALTGPIARGDVAVIEKHLAAIESMPGSSRIDDLYRAAGRIAIELARERNVPHLDELEALLSTKV